MSAIDEGGDTFGDYVLPPQIHSAASLSNTNGTFAVRLIVT
jgi:hypothetical protein